MLKNQRLALITTFALAMACAGPEAGAPTVDALPDLTRQTPLRIGGEAEPRALVQVRGGADPVAEALADADGRFTVEVALHEDAENLLLVSQRVDGVESSATTLRVTHDGTPPAVPNLDPVVSPTRRTSQSLRGQTEPGATVRIAGGREAAEGTADASGRFEIEVQLENSVSDVITTELSIVAADGAGNDSPPAQVAITFDPNIAVEAPMLDRVPSYTSEGTLTLTGTSEPSVAITVVGGAVLGSTIAGADGAFSVDVGLRPNQVNHLLVYASSGANTSAPLGIGVTHDDRAPDAPELDPQGSPTGAVMIRLTGLSEAGALVSVAGGAVPSTGSADLEGSFAVDVMLSMDMTNELRVVASDLAGNESEPVTLTIVQDSSLEAPLSIDPVVSPTSAPVVRLGGSAAASIDIEITGGASTVRTMTGADGAWTADVMLRPNTRNELRVTRPGSGVDTVVVIEHDDIAPDAPMLHPAPSPTGSTTVSLSGATEPRARVSVTGGTAPAAMTTGPDGRFSIDVVVREDDETTLTAIATDRAGNTSLPSMTSITHSSSVPDAPTLDEINPAPTSTPTYVVSGSVANPGPGVMVLVRGGASIASDTTDPSTGVFAVEVTLNPNTSNDLAAVSVDGAIESAEATVTIAHDDIAPSAPTAASLSASSGTCLAGVPTGGTVSGSMSAVEARARVRIENITGRRNAITSATDGGSFSVSIGVCTGDVIRVIAVDAAGNESPFTEIIAG